MVKIEITAEFSPRKLSEVITISRQFLRSVRIDDDRGEEGVTVVPRPAIEQPCGYL